MFVYHVVMLYYDCFVQLLIINEMNYACGSPMYFLFFLWCVIIIVIITKMNAFDIINYVEYYYVAKFKLSTNLTNVQYGCQLRPKVCTETDNKTESWLPEKQSQTISCIPSVFHIDTKKFTLNGITTVSVSRSIGNHVTMTVELRSWHAFLIEIFLRHV